MYAGANSLSFPSLLVVFPLFPAMNTQQQQQQNNRVNNNNNRTKPPLNELVADRRTEPIPAIPPQ